MPKLVWVEGNHGPQPQLLMDDSTFGVKGNSFPCPIIRAFDVSETEAKLGLSALALMFPVDADA